MIRIHLENLREIQLKKNQLREIRVQKRKYHPNKDKSPFKNAAISKVPITDNSPPKKTQKTSTSPTKPKSKPKANSPQKLDYLFEKPKGRQYC